MSTVGERPGNLPDVEGRVQQVVGENLRRVRVDLGFSQESFGQHVGWHRTFVGAVERGERNLTLRTVERISEQLGVHPLELLWDRAGVAVRLDRRGRFIGIGEIPAHDVAAAADGGDGDDAGEPPPGPKRSRPTPG